MDIHFSVNEGFDEIYVLNRLDCCSDRIPGARISVFFANNLTTAIWMSHFSGTQDSYTFAPALSGELYLFNGPEMQYKSVLRYGTNPNGYGDVTTLPTGGGHKTVSGSEGVWFWWKLGLCYKGRRHSIRGLGGLWRQQ